MEEDREASVEVVLHMLDQISLCILYIHKKRNESLLVIAFVHIGINAI